MQITQTTAGFIGREQELVRFRAWLTTTDPNASCILYLHDALEQPEKKGGVGKTWLLRQFAIMAKKVYPDIVTIHIDFFNIGEREGIDIADRAVDALKVAYPDWTPGTFSSVLADYRVTLKAGQENLVEVRNRLADALTTDLKQLEEQLHEDRKYLLLLFDTYELVEKNPLIAVLRLAQAFPDDYDFARMGIVIAGRNPIDWEQPNWRGREHEVTSLAISPFVQEEMLAYLNIYCKDDVPTNPALIQALYDKTEGRPILVGLATDVLNSQTISFEDLNAIPHAEFEQYLVNQINNLERPIDVIILFMAHAYHRFNFELLDWVRHEALFDNRGLEKAPEEVERELLKLSFIRRSNDGANFVLHDEMRPLVAKYCWAIQDPDRRYRKALSKRTIEYYTNLYERTDREQLREAYTVEMLYHKLFQDIDEGYAYFELQFSRATRLLLNAFARSMLQEAQQFLPFMSPAQRFNLKFSEAKLLRKEENSELSLGLYEELEKKADANWLADHQEEIIFEKGVCYQQLSKFDKAIINFTQVKELRKDREGTAKYADILDWLGSVHRQQGQLDIAKYYTEECLEIHRQLDNLRAYANALTNISNIYRLQGKVDEALRRAKLAWRIRYDLFKRGEVSEVYVGWSLGVIGDVYYFIENYPQAEQYFQQTFDIYSRTGYKRGLAAMYNRFGNISMKRGFWQPAIKWYRTAYYAALGVNNEVQISSLDKLGWCLCQEMQYEEAEQYIRQSVDLARNLHYAYHEAEALADLYLALVHQGKHEDALMSFKMSVHLSSSHNYNYLLGVAYEAQGKFECDRDQYHAGLLSYAQSCHYMADFSSLYYKNALRATTDALLEIPAQEIPLGIDTLTRYWKTQGLEHKYPEFIVACDEMRDLIKLKTRMI